MWNMEIMSSDMSFMCMWVVISLITAEPPAVDVKETRTGSPVFVFPSQLPDKVLIEANDCWLADCAWAATAARQISSETAMRSRLRFILLFLLFWISWCGSATGFFFVLGFDE